MDDFQFHFIITHPEDLEIHTVGYYGQSSSYKYASRMGISLAIKFNLILF